MFLDAISLQMSTKGHEANDVFDNLLVNEVENPINRISEFEELMGCSK